MISWLEGWWKCYGEKIKYDLQKWGFGVVFGGAIAALVIWLRKWLAVQPTLVLILLGTVVLLSLACLILIIKLIRTRKDLLECQGVASAKRSPPRPGKTMLDYLPPIKPLAKPSGARPKKSTFGEGGPETS
jgi:hypothetical protein